MRQALHILYIIVGVALMAGCMGEGAGNVEIADECGFGSHTYFSDRFRQHFGMSPSDFRRDALESEKA